MDDNVNTALYIIVGVCILGIIVIAFFDKMPDVMGSATENISNIFHTQ